MPTCIRHEAGESTQSEPPSFPLRRNVADGDVLCTQLGLERVGWRERVKSLFHVTYAIHTSYLLQFLTATESKK